MEKATDTSTKPQGWFATTHWSVVIEAGQAKSPKAASALSHLCQTYWQPLYGYIRRLGYAESDAEDVVQGFFGDFLQRSSIMKADKDRGRFRSFLLASINNYLAKERTKARALKRGGGQIAISLDAPATAGPSFEPTTKETPEIHFERNWAMSLLKRAMNRFADETPGLADGELNGHIKAIVVNDPDAPRIAVLAKKLQVSESALKSRIHRLRQRYQQCVRQEVANTVSSPSEIDDEIRYLLNVLVSD